MKKFLFIACVFFLALTGCRSVSSVTRSITGTDDSLLAQIPQDQLAAVDEARHELDVAEENVVLAEMKEDFAELGEDLAGYEVKLAKNIQENREIQLDTAREQALAKAGYSDPQKSSEILSDLREELIKNESKRFDIEAAIKKTELRMDDLKQRIADQEQRVSAMTGQSVKVSVPESVNIPPAEPGDAGVTTQSSPEPETKAQPQEVEDDVTLPDYLKVQDDPEISNGSQEPDDLEEGSLQN